MNDLDILREAGFSEDEIAAHKQDEAATLRAAGFSEEEIASHYTGLSNPRSIPQSFLQRFVSGMGQIGEGEAASYQAAGKPAQSAIEAAKETWQEGGPIGVPPQEEATLRQWGVWAKPEDQPGLGRGLRLINEAWMKPAYVGSQVLFRSLNSAIAAAGAASGEVLGPILDVEPVRRTRGGAEAMNIAAILAGAHTPIGRAVGPKLGHIDLKSIDQTPLIELPEIEVVGHLPRSQDFTDAARIIAAEPVPPERPKAPLADIRQKLIDLYEKDGIHPAEVASDAKIDPSIAPAIAHPDPEIVPPAYSNGNGVRTPTALDAAVDAIADHPATGVERRIAADVRGKLLAAGIPEGEVDLNAALFATRWYARGAQLGRDPWELYQQANLEIRMGGEAEVQAGSDARAFYQRGGEQPWYYSAVSRAVDDLKMTKASPEQWLNTLRNRPGVKAEELDWLGLEDWLKEQKGAVSKEEVQEYIRANQIEVREVPKGKDSAIEARLAEMDQEIMRLEAAGDPRWQELSRQRGELLRQAPKPTKFGLNNQHRVILPGGEKYRELLLTLPRDFQEPPRPPRLVELDNRLEELDRDISFVHPVDSPERAAAFAERRRLEPEARQLRAEWAKEANRLGEINRGQQFTSGHFDEPNVLAHLRFDDRVIDGKKTLFIEEVQSDWHQAGRKRGYAPDIAADKTELERLKQKSEQEYESRIRLRAADDKAGEEAATARILSLVDQMNVLHDRIADAERGNFVPNAPFKTTWPELALKRMLRYAAENGYEKLAWTSGETQAARYDLSKQISRIVLHDNSSYGIGKPRMEGEFTSGRLMAFDHGNRKVIETGVGPEELSDAIGKEAAEKLLAAKPTASAYGGIGVRERKLEGLDLQVGGEGMKGFYDQILPATANKLVKKYGARVADARMLEGSPEKWKPVIDDAGMWRLRHEDDGYISSLSFDSKEDALKELEQGKAHPVHTLNLTPALKDAATTQGFPLFQRGEAEPPRGKITIAQNRAIIELFKSADASTFLHESGHLWLEQIVADAQLPDASPQIKTDLKTVLDWFGIEKPEDITTEHHEQWARGFERYLAEGKAPKPELQGIFDRFRQWLLAIYRTLEEFNSPINDEIRGVYDRLFLTPEEMGIPQRELVQNVSRETLPGARLPSGTTGFTTAKGSTYQVHEDGTTTRNKAARADVGHEGDFGPKARSEKTVYVATPEQASALSSAGLQNVKGSRVIIKDGKASLLTWNEKAGKWGRAPSGTDVPIFDEPAVGRAPLELWKKTDDISGYESYASMHAGNPITEITAPATPRGILPEVAAKVMEDFQRFGVGTAQVRDRIEAIRQNFGDEQAKFFESEYQRLVNQAVEVRKAAKSQAEPAPASHSAAAQTGNPAVDAVVNDPVVKVRIDNPTIENSKEVPYGAGASAKPDDPTTHLDKSIPREATISGVTFDPAVPANIHEQVERVVMEREIARFKAEHGREPDKAEMDKIWDYAHHDFAEPAENAWVRAQGIEVHQYDLQWIKWLRKTSTEDTADAPPDLYRKPYNATPEGRLHGDKDMAALSDEEAAKKLFAERPPGGAPETEEPPLPVVEIKPKSTPGGTAARPEETWSLLQFLAAKGGIRSDEKLISDLRQSIGRDNLFVPSFGTLIRPPRQISEAARRGGRFAPKTLDAARETAAEAGYLPMDSTPADLLDLIDRELRGSRVYREGYLPPERQMDPVERELHEDRFIESLQDKVKANGGELTEAEAARAREIWLREGISDPDEIIERIFLESKDDADRAGTYEPVYVPGWDDAAHAAGTPRPGDVLQQTAGREGAAGEPIGPSGGEDAGADIEFFQRQRRRGAKDLIAEREAEGQLPLPGTERIGQGELAQRKAEEPLKPTVEQKPMDIGLFGDQAKQKTLFQEGRPVAEEVLRARGFDLSRPLYHQTKATAVPSILDQGFDLSKARARLADEGVPDGVFLKPDQRDIGVGGRGAEAAQIPLFVRYGKTETFRDRTGLRARLDRDPEYQRLADEANLRDKERAREFNAIEKTLHDRNATDEEYDAADDKARGYLRSWQEENERNATAARKRATEILRADGVETVRILNDAGGWGRSTETVIAIGENQIAHAGEPLFGKTLFQEGRKPLFQPGREFEQAAQNANSPEGRERSRLLFHYDDRGGFPKFFDRVISTWQRTFQPHLISDVSLQSEPFFRAMMSQRQGRKDVIAHMSEEERQYWRHAGEEENFAYLSMVERGQLRMPQTGEDQAAQAMRSQKIGEWQEKAVRHREMLDAAHELEKQYGSRAAFIEDYIGHLFEDPVEARDFFMNRGRIMGPTWFQKERIFDYIDEARAHGLRLRSNNAEWLISMRLFASADMVEKMDLLYNIRDEVGAAVQAKNADPNLSLKGWQEVRAPNRERWLISRDLMPTWDNSIEAYGLLARPGDIGDFYRTWMAFKNAWVPIKLSVSGFHPIHVLEIAWFDGLAAALTHVIQGGDPVTALKIAGRSLIDPLIAAPGASIGAGIGATIGGFSGVIPPLGAGMGAALGFLGGRGITGRMAMAAQGAALGMTVPGGALVGAGAGAVAGAATLGALERLGLVERPYHPGRFAADQWKLPFEDRTPLGKAYTRILNEAGTVPTQSAEMAVKGKEAFEQAWDNRQWGRAILPALSLAIKTIQAPIFEQWIPALKTASVIRQAELLLDRRPDLIDNNVQRRAALTQIGKSADARFGEMFYGNLFWDAYVKDLGKAYFLSLGWQIGGMRDTLAGPVVFPISRAIRRIARGPATETEQTVAYAQNIGTYALTYLGGTMLIAGMISMANTGETPQGLDWFFPRSGRKNPDGSDHRLTTQSYTREIPMAQKHIEEQGGNVPAGLAEMLYNKGVIQPFVELARNKDYWGTEVMDENAPFYKRWAQAVQHFLGDQVNPMSLTGAQRALLTGGRPEEAGLSLLGFGPAPAYAERSATQNRIQYLYGLRFGGSTRPMEQGEKATQRSDLKNEILLARERGDTRTAYEAEQQWLEAGGSPRSLGNLLSGIGSDVSMFRRLPEGDQEAIMARASPGERQKYLPYFKPNVARDVADLMWQQQIARQRGDANRVNALDRAINTRVQEGKDRGQITDAKAFNRSVERRLIEHRAPELGAMISLPKRERGKFIPMQAPQ